jgi:RNA polymerase sigma-70 factor (ECF subfamily)
VSAAHRNESARVTRAVTEHAPALLGYFARRVDPAHHAADLLSETLLVLWRRAAALPADDDAVRPWMFGIARNVLLHHHRRTARQHAMADRLRSMLSVSPHEGFADPTEYADLHEAVRSLDLVDREIIGLVHWEGFTLAQTARVMKMKEGTLRSRYHRARARLRERLVADAETAECRVVGSTRA